VVSCEQGNEPSGSIKSRVIVSFSSRVSLHVVSCLDTAHVQIGDNRRFAKTEPLRALVRNCLQHLYLFIVRSHMCETENSSPHVARS